MNSVYSTPEVSSGGILGFSMEFLLGGKKHSSDAPVDIIKDTAIHIDINITSKAFYIDKSVQFTSFLIFVEKK